MRFRANLLFHNEIMKFSLNFSAKFENVNKVSQFSADGSADIPKIGKSVFNSKSTIFEVF